MKELISGVETLISFSNDFVRINQILHETSFLNFKRIPFSSVLKSIKCQGCNVSLNHQSPIFFVKYLSQILDLKGVFAKNEMEHTTKNKRF